MSPVHFVLSKLALEQSSDKRKGKLQNFLTENFEKFEYQHDLYTYLKSLTPTKEVVDDIFETTNEENADFQVYERSRDHEGLEDSMQTEAISTLFEEVNNKSEIEYLNQNFASIVENTLINLDYLNVRITEGKEKDKIVISKIVTLIMISLYNLRQQYKIREESKKESSPTKSKSLKRRFKTLKEVIDRLCKKETELQEFIQCDKLKFDTLDSANNVFNVLNSMKFFSDPIHFKCFTNSCLMMLRSTAIACPQLSISLIQCWFPMMSNLISASVKKNIDCSIIIRYNINRIVMMKLTE